MSAIMDWFKRKEVVKNVTQNPVFRPKNVDYTESLNVNRDLTTGLYHNSYPDLKLAGSLAYAPIAVPVWFMGIPVITTNSDKEEDQKLIADINKRVFRKYEQIHTQCHREGTIWIFPRYSAKLGEVIWEFITDDIVTDIIKNFETNEIKKLIVEDQIKISTDYNETATVKRRRIYEKTKITYQYTRMSGTIDITTLNRTTRNIAGIIPIPFSNNNDGDEYRGHSDYERIIPDLKAYHDIEYADLIMLAKFNTKMVQTVTNWESWKSLLLDVNSWSSMAELDLPKLDLIINQTGESTDFIWPKGAHEAAKSKLKNLFHKIVEGATVPEIFWGLKTEGNHASAFEQMNIGMKYVENKQDQKTEKYEVLIEKTIMLEKIARMINTDIDITVKWNDLEMVAPEIKAKIFSDYSTGIKNCIDSAGWTKNQMFELWKTIYPNITKETFEEYKLGISDMASFKQFREQDYQMSQDGMPGADDLTNDEI